MRYDEGRGAIRGLFLYASQGQYGGVRVFLVGREEPAMPRPISRTTLPALIAALMLASGKAAWAQSQTDDPVPAPAPEAPGPETPGLRLSFAANAGVASDYVFRGVDQTDGRVQGFGGLDLSRGRLYLGTWASNVDFSRFGDRRTSAEVDAYGGWRPSLAGFDLDLGAIYYGYTGRAGAEGYAEGYAKASRAIGPVTGGLSLYATPNYQRPAGAGYYVEANAAYALTRKLSFTAAVGRQQKDHALADAAAPGCAATAFDCRGPYRDLAYVTWNLGGVYALTDHVSLDLRYVDTDAHDLGEPYRARVALTAKASFP